MGLTAQRFVALLGFRNFKGFPGDIVEGVVAGILYRGVVVLPETSHSRGFSHAGIATRHMVGNNVDDHLHAGLMGAVDQRAELLQPLCRVHRQVGIDTVVIPDRIGRSGTPLDDVWVVGGNPKCRIVGDRGMMRNPRIPYMGHPQCFDFL